MTKLQTTVQIQPMEPKFGYPCGCQDGQVSVATSAGPAHNSIMFVGSCFAQEMGRRCQEHYLDTLVNPFGVLFNPCSIASCLGSLEGYSINPCGCSFVPSDVIETSAGFCSFYHHSSFARPSAQEFLDNANSNLATASEFYERKGWVVVTLGSAYVYTDKDSGIVVSNCHKLPQSRFERRRLSVDECVQALGHYVGGNPQRQWIFTVSPVRHLADGLHDNQLSKSTLLLAVSRIVERFENAHYFPAYEIMMDELRDYRFYADDMLHPSQLAADIIFERFTEWGFDAQQKPLLDEAAGLRSLMAHRPLNPDTAKAKEFLAERDRKLQQFLAKTR